MRKRKKTNNYADGEVVVHVPLGSIGILVDNAAALLDGLELSKVTVENRYVDRGKKRKYSEMT
jgi:hypothetical protein